MPKRSCLGREAPFTPTQSSLSPPGQKVIMKALGPLPLLLSVHTETGRHHAVNTPVGHYHPHQRAEPFSSLVCLKTAAECSHRAPFPPTPAFFPSPPGFFGMNGPTTHPSVCCALSRAAVCYVEHSRNTFQAQAQADSIPTLPSPSFDASMDHSRATSCPDRAGNGTVSHPAGCL